jgi:hypothetical protein
MGRRNTQNGKTEQKETTSMNSSDSLSLVQGPSAVACMKLTYLSTTIH